MIQGASASALRLWRSFSAMNDSDELFRWFIDIAVQQAGIQVIQLWTCRSDYLRPAGLALRAFAYQDVSLAKNGLISAPATAMIEHILMQQEDVPLQPVQNIFSSHLAALLRRHSLNYAAGYGVKEELYLSVRGTSRDVEFSSVSQRMVLLLFLSAPLQIPFSEICALLQQALNMAERCHLLQLHHTVHVPEVTLAEEPFFHIEACVPRRAADVASNPLAFAITIADKNARNLYAAIDDQRTIGELAMITHLTIDETCKALQFLLGQRRIQVYEHGDGKPVDGTVFMRQGG